MRALSDGRGRGDHGMMLAFFLVGVCYLACVGAFVTVRALVEWLT
jgi:hypothetical protein